MNILPKKRWHVGRPENIERVRRDEAKYAEEQEGKRQQTQRAEHEYRMQILRNRAGVEKSNQDIHVENHLNTSSDLLDSIEGSISVKEPISLKDPISVKDPLTARHNNNHQSTAILNTKNNSSLRDEKGHLNLFKDSTLFKDNTEVQPKSTQEIDEDETPIDRRERLKRQREDEAYKLGGIRGDQRPWYSQQDAKTDIRGRLFQDLDKPGTLMNTRSDTQQKVLQRDDLRKFKQDPMQTIRSVLSSSNQISKNTTHQNSAPTRNVVYPTKRSDQFSTESQDINHTNSNVAKSHFDRNLVAHNVSNQELHTLLIDYDTTDTNTIHRPSRKHSSSRHDRSDKVRRKHQDSTSKNKKKKKHRCSHHTERQRSRDEHKHPQDSSHSSMHRQNKPKPSSSTEDSKNTKNNSLYNTKPSFDWDTLRKQRKQREQVERQKELQLTLMGGA